MLKDTQKPEYQFVLTLQQAELQEEKPVQVEIVLLTIGQNLDGSSWSMIKSQKPRAKIIKIQERKSYLDEDLYLITKMSLQVCTDGLVGNLRLWSVQELVSSALFYNRQSIHDETVTTNREIVANHLAYTLLYMFLVAGYL